MRQVFSVIDLIASLGVEEKVIAKNNRDKKFEGGFSINLVQKRNAQASHNKATTNFMKKSHI